MITIDRIINPSFPLVTGPDDLDDQIAGDYNVTAYSLAERTDFLRRVTASRYRSTADALSMYLEIPTAYLGEEARRYEFTSTAPAISPVEIRANPGNVDGERLEIQTVGFRDFSFRASDFAFPVGVAKARNSVSQFAWSASAGIWICLGSRRVFDRIRQPTNSANSTLQSGGFAGGSLELVRIPVSTQAVQDGSYLRASAALMHRRTAAAGATRSPVVYTASIQRNGAPLLGGDEENSWYLPPDEGVAATAQRYSGSLLVAGEVGAVAAGDVFEYVISVAIPTGLGDPSNLAAFREVRILADLQHVPAY